MLRWHSHTKNSHTKVFGYHFICPNTRSEIKRSKAQLVSLDNEGMMVVDKKKFKKQVVNRKPANKTKKGIPDKNVFLIRSKKNCDGDKAIRAPLKRARTNLLLASH